MKTKLLRFVQKYPIWSALLAYLLLALLFTFPLALRINSEIPKGGGDFYQVISAIDVQVQQMQGLDLTHKALFAAKHFGTFTPYVLLDQFLNKIVSYNILFLLTYVLSGLGMFLLARYMVKNEKAAFVAGIIFAFAPFHYYQSVAVHLGTMQQQWLPLLVLFLFKFFEKFEVKYFLAAGFFALLVAMSEHQLLAFTAVFVGIFVGYQIWMDRNIMRNKKFWVYVLCSALLLGAVAFGMFGELLKVATSDNNFLDPGENAANRYAIKVLDPLMPPVFHAIWGGVAEKVQSLIWGGSNRGSYFVSFAVVALLIWFAYLLRKKKIAEMQDAEYRRNLFFWSLSSGLIYIFALGTSFALGKWNIPLPYYLIYKFVPFYNNIRTTGRFFVFVMLGVSMLFAYAFVELLKKNPQKKSKLTAVFSALILLEFWVAPIGTMPVAYSKFYDRIAQDEEQYKLIEIPGSTSYEFASYAMFTQSVHKKEDLNGMPLARKISGQFALQKNTPVIKQLLYTIPKGNDPEKKVDNPAEEFQNANLILNQNNVRYITISKKYASSKIIQSEEKFIQKYIKYNSKYEDEFLIAYEVAK